MEELLQDDWYKLADRLIVEWHCQTKIPYTEAVARSLKREFSVMIKEKEALWKTTEYVPKELSTKSC